MELQNNKDPGGISPDIKELKKTEGISLHLYMFYDYVFAAPKVSGRNKRPCYKHSSSSIWVIICYRWICKCIYFIPEL